ncbi:MAG: hypothetical protein OEO21_10475 [Candidatus Krumholzibacteria bacterium]|nr:hypothetical protein [Candidatus Krumholzibacteria bacterium]
MPKIGWVVIVLALLEGGWLAFDGARAFVAGDYVTPRSGRHAGELGPWSKLVTAVGIDPRSTLMKGIHVAVGGAWLVAIAAFAWGASWSWWAMLACAVAGLWYLPFGTLLSLIQIVLLMLVRQRGG